MISRLPAAARGRAGLCAASLLATASGTAVEVAARLGLALVAQPDGSLLATGPDSYSFTFLPGECGIAL